VSSVGLGLGLPYWPLIGGGGAAVPSITGLPTISGTLYEGNTLTATAASVTGNPTPATTWQWERDGTPISGATSSTYTLVSADGNADITVVQTETNSQGSDTAESAASTIEAGPVISGVPTISGTETVGSTLTATAASVTGTPTPTRTWQWQRSADGSTGWADISGATSATYTLVSADENEYVRAVQTETNTSGGQVRTDSAESVASGQITAVSGAFSEVTWDSSADTYTQTLDSSVTLPLDGVSNVLAAYSTAFQLRSAYTGDGVRVRRSSDNTEQDIGFNDASELDQSALTTFTGANNGFVATIYDQSGSALDVDQATAAEQPQIVTSGSVENINGEPAPDFGGTSILEAASPVGGNRTSLYVAVVVEFANNASLSTAAGSYNSGIDERSWVIGEFDNRLNVALSEDGTASNLKAYRSGVSSSGFHVVAFKWESSALTLYLDGVAVTSPTVIRDDSFSTLNDTTAPLTVGAYISGSVITAALSDQLAEVIVVGDATDRVAIEQSMLDRYGISGTAS
jgi:hypothetical protein